MNLRKTHFSRSRFMLVSMLLVSMLLCHPVWAQQSYSKLIAFGDSLSDTGNLASLGVPFIFPYHDNRISDGPVALDYLAAAIGSNADASLHLDNKVGGFNYSVAGGNIVGGDVEDFGPQLTAFLARVGGSADPLALYAIVLGGNDLRDIRGIQSALVAEQRIDEAVILLIAQLTQLADAGAQYFLIANVPDVGRIPETIGKESADPGISARATAYTQSYNQKLAVALAGFRQSSSSDVIEFDFFQNVQIVISNAAALGFWHTTVGCFTIDGYKFHDDCLFGTRFDRFVFFDNLHPSGASHLIIGNAMAQTLLSYVPPAVDGQPRLAFLSGILLLLLDD